MGHLQINLLAGGPTNHARALHYWRTNSSSKTASALERLTVKESPFAASRVASLSISTTALVSRLWRLP